MSEVAHIKARVELTLDIPITESWAIECPMSQVRDQAIAKAKMLVARVLGEQLKCTVVGAPRVTLVTSVIEEPGR